MAAAAALRLGGRGLLRRTQQQGPGRVFIEQQRRLFAKTTVGALPSILILYIVFLLLSKARSTIGISCMDAVTEYMHCSFSFCD
jgi:hypothetical protein